MEWQKNALRDEGRAENNENESAPVIDLYPRQEFLLSSLPAVSLFDALEIPALIVDSEGIITRINQECSKVLALPMTDIINQPAVLLIPELQSFDFSKFLPDPISELTVQIKTHPRIFGIFKLQIVRIQVDDKHSFLFALKPIVSGSETKSSHPHRSHLNIILDNVRGPALITREKVILCANQSMVDLLGYANPYEIAGMEINKFILPDEKGIISADEGEYECSLMKNDGSSFPVLVKNKVYGSEENEINLYKFSGINTLLSSSNMPSELCSIIHSTADFYCILNNDGEFEFLNRAFIDFLGYEPKEILGRKLDILFSVHAAGIQLTEIEQKMRSAGKFEDTIVCKKKSGELFYFSLRIGIIRKTCLLSSGYVVTGEDVTEKICSRTESQIQQDRYKVIVEQISDLVFVIRADGVIEFASPSVFEQLKIQLSELDGKEFTSLIPDAGKESINKQLYTAATTETETFSFETELLTSDGQKHPFQAAGKKIFETGGIIKFIIALRNISEQTKLLNELNAYKDNLENLIQKRTDELVRINEHLTNEVSWRKEAEQELMVKEGRLALALEVSAYGLVDINLDTDSVYYNERFSEIAGIPRDKKISATSQFIESFIHPDDLHYYRDQFKKHLLGEEEFVEIELRFKSKDDILKHISMRGKVINRDTDGVPLRFIGRFEDISVRKKAEEKLALSLEREKELLELKTQFISILSHEYRTPLATILSSAEILEMYDSQLNQQARFEQIRKIERCVDEMSKMLEEVITINKCDLEKVNYAKVDFEVISYARSIINEMTANYKELPAIQFNALIQKLTVHSSPVLFKQVLGNLFSNALKYTPVGKTISILVSMHASQVLIEIQDTGIGIHTEDQKMLFEPFFRGKNVGTIPGSGLGLSIVKRSVDALNGKVSFVSQPNIGTTFRVELPLELC